MMGKFIDISDRARIHSLLLALREDTVPLWGKMNARQMAEHLVDAIAYSNGAFTCECERTPEDAACGKQAGVYTGAEIPRNVFLGDLPANFIYSSLQTAIDELMNQLTIFDTYFQQKDVTAVHGGFGAMTHQEWLIWHGKHFTHHFKQFGLVPVNL